MGRFLVVIAVVGCGGPARLPPESTVEITPPPAPQAGPAANAAASAIAHAYQLVTIESAVPGDPLQLREAAITALAPKGWEAAPIEWTGDPARDVAVLHDAVITLALRGELAPDAVLRAARAIALAANDTNTFAMAKSSVQALFALIGGGPVVQPGMLYHRLDDGTWAVSDVLPDGPAQRAGVQRGDVLVTIDGASIKHGYMDFAPLLGAPEGTQAELVVERAGETLQLELTMSAVAAPIVESRVLAGGIGYLRLWACTRADDPQRDAGKLVELALADFDKKQVKQLVLDLRGNSGGYPFDVASLLVDTDPLLLAVGGDGTEQPVARTKLAAWKTKRRTAVIVDEQTASGAEMLAFALRDGAKATIVGRPTAGGLTFPTTEKLTGDVTLSYPLSRVGGAQTKGVLDGNRLVPDVTVANATAEDYAAGRDPQLAAAIAAVKKAAR